MPILFVLLVALPLAELYVVIKVADWIGVLETIVLMVAMSVAGAWWLKQQGTQTWRRAQESIQRGEMPTEHAVDGALILIGGALLLTPGFLTDIVGLLFLFPPTRRVLKGTGRRILVWWTLGRFGRGGQPARVYREARVVRSSRARTPRRDGPTRPPQLPGEEPMGRARRPGEAGSPGTG